MPRLEYETPRPAERPKAVPAIKLAIAVSVLPGAALAVVALARVAFDAPSLRTESLVIAGITVAAGVYACWAAAKELFGPRPPVA